MILFLRDLTKDVLTNNAANCGSRWQTCNKIADDGASSTIDFSSNDPVDEKVHV
jgi:hypothetical protein